MHDELERVLNRGVAAPGCQIERPFRRPSNASRCRVEAGIPPGTPLRCSDADDQMFIDLALAAGAQWLFTRDRALLRLARRASERGVVVLRPSRLASSMTPAN